MPTSVKSVEFGGVTFPRQLWQIYTEYIASLGNDFLPNDIGPRKRAKQRCANAKKTLIKRAKFYGALKSVEERAHVMAQERNTFVRDNIVR